MGIVPLSPGKSTYLSMVVSGYGVQNEHPLPDSTVRRTGLISVTPRFSGRGFFTGNMARRVSHERQESTAHSETGLRG